MNGNEKPNYEMAKDKAFELLERNYITEPAVLADELARTCGLNVYCANFSDFGDEYDGISGFIYGNDLFVNSQEPPVRQNFTIAHELGHYILHHTEKSGCSVLYRDYRKNNSESPMEQEANCFAANLLVPEKFIKKIIKDYPFATNLQLSRIFGVSEVVIRIRKSQLGIS